MQFDGPSGHSQDASVPVPAFTVVQPDPVVGTLAGVRITRSQLQGTLSMYRYVAGVRFFGFEIRGPGDVHPHILDEPGIRLLPLTPKTVRASLWRMLDRAINRKAGLTWPKKATSDHQAAWRRDQWLLRDHLERRVIIRRFETKECRERFGHLVFQE
jgi:hypothetical protein